MLLSVYIYSIGSFVILCVYQVIICILLAYTIVSIDLD